MADNKLSEGAQAIIQFLQDKDADASQMFTFRDIADAIGRAPRSVSATITSLVKKGYAERVVVGENKLIHLTDAGFALSFNVQED